MPMTIFLPRPQSRTSVLSKLELLVKIVFCVFDQSFLYSIDRNCCISTALLAVCLSKSTFLSHTHVLFQLTYLSVLKPTKTALPARKTKSSKLME